MRWIRVALVTVLLCLGVVPTSPVMAQANVTSDACDAAPDATLCADDSSQEIDDNALFGPNGFLTKVARFIAVISGIAGVIMIIIGGIRYILASGDASNINSAKDTILYALIGMVIAAASQALVIFVLNRL